jgi:parvulin-like peptidyl-prolyl isomerase
MWELAGTVQVTEAEEIDELIKSLPAIGKEYYVNIQEILCDSAGAAARVLDDLGKRIPFGSVAQRYSIRKAWVAAGGISGYFPISEYPILGCTAMLADTGVIIGPVKLPEGYSIFKVLGKQKSAAGNYPSVDSVRINVHTNLMTNKRQQSLNRFIAGAANKNDVQLYYDKLHEVDIQPSNMFTRRYIGFGGVITASPLLYPNSEWVKEWQDAKNIIP